MMKQIIRAQYRAALRKDMAEEKLDRAVLACRRKMEKEKQEGRLLTGGLFRYHELLFLYMEYVTEGRDHEHWAYMYPVFWFDTPKDLETWKRKKAPDKRCGRIAVLYPDKLFSYVCSHQAIVKEGLLTGDRYQMISLHENLLFSYFETPRDREQVNIRREEGESLEIQKWEAADPAGHFIHFPEAGGENFLVIETVISVG